MSTARKHGVTFEEAATIFADPLAMVITDVVHAGRTLIIDESIMRRVLLTVFVERDEEETCTISAPRPTNHERGTMNMGKRRRQREPSKTSLRDIPAVDFSKARVRRNPYAARIAEEGIVVQVGRGRPKRLLEVGGTHPRSVRFPNAIWKQIEARAKAKGLTLHAALREAIIAWLEAAA